MKKLIFPGIFGLVLSSSAMVAFAGNCCPGSCQTQNLEPIPQIQVISPTQEILSPLYSPSGSPGRLAREKKLAKEKRPPMTLPPANTNAKHPKKVKCFC